VWVYPSEQQFFNAMRRKVRTVTRVGPCVEFSSCIINRPCQQTGLEGGWGIHTYERPVSAVLENNAFAPPLLSTLGI
jgi:hypothetical protein